MANSPSGKASAMLRYLLARADKVANSEDALARPAKQAELHLEELLDCIDPDHADPEAEKPDEHALIADIAASAQWDWEHDKPAEPAGPMGFDSNEAALESLLAFRKYSAMAPEDIDVSDLDPQDHDS